MDERFRYMVLLVKEWAKAQNINDPKNGTLNSYSLCLLVLFHFQTCKPAILPPMKDIFDLNISEGCGRFNEKNLDQYCVENITKFQRQDRGQKNESPLSHLLATFFEKFCHILVRSSDHRISTYTGQLKRIQGNLFSMTKSYCLFVEDPFQTSDNAARTVDVAELQRITRAFTQAKYMISDRRASRNELLSLLCTPEVSSELGAGATAGRRTNPATSPQQHRSTGYVGYVAANPYGNRYDQRARGTTGSIPVHNPANRHAGTTRAVGGRLQNGSTSNSRPQASSSSAWQW
uniref:Uncharacterized protein n=1 Tax=Avena sativa TaxID=4498 RepID=A0ACD5WIE6_AVESA